MATCARCSQPTAGNSKYCKVHRSEARAAWKAMITASNEERQARKDGHAELYAKACAAGLAAALAAQPTPMVVQQRANPLNDNSPVVQSWYVAGGVCGFAWVIVRPGNSSFARWLADNAGARPAYEGGMRLSVHVPSEITLKNPQLAQSLEIMEAYAHAFAEVVRSAGINAYANSRLD